MKSLYSAGLTIACMCCVQSLSIGQEVQRPKPGPAFDIFKSDIGVWDVEIKT